MAAIAEPLRSKRIEKAIRIKSIDFVKLKREK